MPACSTRDSLKRQNLYIPLSAKQRMPADRERRTFPERGLRPRLSFLKENEKPYRTKKENRAGLSNLGWPTLIYIQRETLISEIAIKSKLS